MWEEMLFSFFQELTALTNWTQCCLSDKNALGISKTKQGRLGCCKDCIRNWDGNNCKQLLII